MSYGFWVSMVKSIVRRTGVALVLRKVRVRDLAKHCTAGFVASELLTDDADDFFDAPIQVVAEVSEGRETVGQCVRRAHGSGMHVVTANKSLLAGEAPELVELARAHGVSIAFEASSAGGIPL